MTSRAEGEGEGGGLYLIWRRSQGRDERTDC